MEIEVIEEMVRIKTELQNQKMLQENHLEEKKKKQQLLQKIKIAIIETVIINTEVKIVTTLQIILLKIEELILVLKITKF